MTKKIDELMQICDAATPGPWLPTTIKETSGTFHFVEIDGLIEGEQTPTVCDPNTKQDMDFIIAAREWFPRLLKTVKESHQNQSEDVYCPWCDCRILVGTGEDYRKEWVDHAPDCISVSLELVE